MHKTHYLFLAITAFFCFAGTINPVKGQTINTQISDDSLAAGDRVTLSITLATAQEYDQIIFPDTSYFSTNFELRQRQHFSVADFKDSLAYQIQFWGVEDEVIPSMPVNLIADGDTTTLFTQPVLITFQTVLESENPELRPLKPIFDFARAWWMYLVGLLLLLALAAIARYYYKKRKARPEPAAPAVFKAPEFLNPLRELENNLQKLKNIPRSDNPDFKQFYIDLGDAIRLYFEQMFHIPALESTSREILVELARREVDERLVKDTRTVLNEADMVKFAKFKPTKEQAQKAYQKAEDFHSTVKELHYYRIEMQHKQHLEQVERDRKTFNEAQKQEETV